MCELDQKGIVLYGDSLRELISAAHDVYGEMEKAPRSNKSLDHIIHLAIFTVHVLDQGV
jgi:hypothetical protein